MSTTKPFLSIDEQIELLKSRGFSITDEEYSKAEQFFLNNNYYRISGYTLTLRKNDIFLESASLETLIQIYEADRRMRHVMLSIIEVIEVRVKSMLAYYHSEKYGPIGYLDINNFSCIDNGNIDLKVINNYLYITRKADSQKNAMAESELFIKHHKENKKDILPFWVYVEVLTISDASKLYTILDEELRKKIAFQIGFRTSKGHDILENLLHCVTILRNISAHGGRLYNRLFTRKPWLSKKEKALLRIEDGNIIYNKLFSYILVLKSLTSPQDFSLVIEHINQIYDQYPLIKFSHYGFPDNWKEIL
jgi:abortive infection bacteriophage resistance protein